VWALGLDRSKPALDDRGPGEPLDRQCACALRHSREFRLVSGEGDHLIGERLRAFRFNANPGARAFKELRAFSASAEKHRNPRCERWEDF